ncbi:M23 family metallopeptidase [Cohnella sp. JJ-181]|uniref:M23 family metallopeptidase n=1 Tax=Cohnella rhizoplanae TaxID=2974897 RepID=UPI0022FF8DC6|nr:M23 family metallopeptidase [Cohnella sp. JJ-181]CAI6038625.1 L-Ala--D-Glu endopeptidase [Cohnella sp. JJ-181]
MLKRLTRQARKLRHPLRIALAASALAWAWTPPAQGQEIGADETARRELYDRVAAITGLTWQKVAAIDQYERTMSRLRPKERPLGAQAISGAYVAPERWAGELNPNAEDRLPLSIGFFGGIGRDGSGDGQADRHNDVDRLYTVVRQTMLQGPGADNMAIGLWEYYQNPRAVQRVQQFDKLYAAFGTLNLSKHAFPLPLNSVYSYRSTWGNRRGWGGVRVHEGTDIFAGQGVPVRSTCYGVVEVKGWNKFGGWRIGIRDIDNLYHYYAHLSGFDKSIHTGDVVEPGRVIGWVGSSGYGRPGTQGKFPPHLHYGVYRDRGLVEWAFDPYPMLHSWERAERRAVRSRGKGGG